MKHTVRHLVCFTVRVSVTKPIKLVSFIHEITVTFHFRWETQLVPPTTETQIEFETWYVIMELRLGIYKSLCMRNQKEAQTEWKKLNIITGYKVKRYNTIYFTYTELVNIHVYIVTGMCWYTKRNVIGRYRSRAKSLLC